MRFHAEIITFHSLLAQGWSMTCCNCSAQSCFSLGSASLSGLSGGRVMRYVLQSALDENTQIFIIFNMYFKNVFSHVIFSPELPIPLAVSLPCTPHQNSTTRLGMGTSCARNSWAHFIHCTLCSTAEHISFSLGVALPWSGLGSRVERTGRRWRASGLVLGICWIPSWCPKV